MKRARVIAIGGPTGVGKSALALALADEIGGEIVSADSVQVYRGFDIGSAKPSLEEQRAVPHHLVDICDPTELYSAARFVVDADAAIEEIAGRGRVPIVVGGTGLYVRSLLQGLFDAPHDADVRARLRSKAESGMLPALAARLAEVDPASASRISPNDAVRVVRALEVFEVTGVALSEHQAAHGLKPRYEAFCVTLSRPRGRRDARIGERARLMLEAGLEQETAELFAAYPDAPALGSLGYRQVCDVMQNGAPESQLFERIRVETRRFAKRQLTWFRGQWASRWYNLEEEATPAEVRAAATAWLGGSSPGEDAPWGTANDATFRD